MFKFSFSDQSKPSPPFQSVHQPTALPPSLFFCRLPFFLASSYLSKHKKKSTRTAASFFSLILPSLLFMYLLVFMCPFLIALVGRHASYHLIIKSNHRLWGFVLPLHTSHTHAHTVSFPPGRQERTLTST